MIEKIQDHHPCPYLWFDGQIIHESEVVLSPFTHSLHYSSTGLKTKVSNILRLDPRSSQLTMKMSGQYTNIICAKKEVAKQGFDEAILLTTKNTIAEASGANMFIVRKKIVYTPAADGYIFPGITRNVVINLLRKKNVPVIEADANLSLLDDADEAFCTGTALGVVPIRQNDNRVLFKNHPGEISLMVMNAYAEYIESFI